MGSNIPTMSLKRFMMRSEVLRLYREFLRSIRKIPNKEQQKDLQHWIRHDFDTNRHHTDEIAIKMMITKGRMSLKELQESIHMAG